MRSHLKVLLAGGVLALSQAIAASDLDDTWIMEIKMRSGTGRSTFSLEQKGDSIVSGTVKDSVVAFGYRVELQGVPAEVTYVGAIEAGVMRGTVSIVGFGDGTFVGTKQL